MAFSPIKFFRIRFQIARANPLFWGHVVLIAWTLGFIFYWPSPVTDSGPSDFRLRLWGVFLQILGASIVWWDLTDSARAFGRPSFFANTLTWLKRLAKGHEVVTATGQATLPIRITVRGRVCHPPPPTDTPLDDRVHVLEGHINRIDDELSAAVDRIIDTETKLQDKISEESRKREEANKELLRNLENSIIGNYASLSFGAVWVVIGMLLSAFSQDIARGVAGQWSMVWAYL